MLDMPSVCTGLAKAEIGMKATAIQESSKGILSGEIKVGCCLFFQDGELWKYYILIPPITAPKHLSCEADTVFSSFLFASCIDTNM
jgi:hypothetical protein